ncbi:MAG: hypothetical protein LCH59_09400 [Proteobacteria bacterium]|nr:hypothetical protein [Pseudomonadota bacterium]
MRTILAVMTLLVATLNTPAHADDICDLDILESSSQTIVGENPERQWVNFSRTDAEGSGSRVIAKDEPIFSADFQKMSEASSLLVPNSFAFRSKWPLGPRPNFKQGMSLPIKTVYTVPSGERFYMFYAPGDNELWMFARPDGTLCNKVINASGGTYVFMVGEYASNPSTKLRSATETDANVPVKLRIIYLGASGGIASFRTILSRDGRILETQEVQYDQTATKLAIAGMEIPVSNMTSSSVTVGEIPLNSKIAWSAYWSALFNK